MNLAQVEAYLADDVPAAQPLAHWAAKPVDPRAWEPLSKLQRMFPLEFGISVRKLGGRKSPVEVNGEVYPSLVAAADAVGIRRQRLAEIAGTVKKRKQRYRRDYQKEYRARKRRERLGSQ